MMSEIPNLKTIDQQSCGWRCYQRRRRVWGREWKWDLSYLPVDVLFIFLREHVLKGFVARTQNCTEVRDKYFTVIRAVLSLHGFEFFGVETKCLPGPINQMTTPIKMLEASTLRRNSTLGFRLARAAVRTSALWLTPKIFRM